MNMTDQRGCEERFVHHDLYVSNTMLGMPYEACLGDHTRQLIYNQLLAISAQEAPGVFFCSSCIGLATVYVACIAILYVPSSIYEYQTWKLYSPFLPHDTFVW